jgi:hypothetical protein
MESRTLVVMEAKRTSTSGIGSERKEFGARAPGGRTPPYLRNAKHENFAIEIAKGIAPAQAYINVGYSGRSSRGAAASASRLLKTVAIAHRIAEISVPTAAGVLQAEIGNCAWLVVLHDTAARLFKARDARTKEPAIPKAPGGDTGLVTITVPALRNPKHEKFAVEIAQGIAPAQAYVNVGYSGRSWRGAAASASRLQKTVAIADRKAEISATIAAGAIQAGIGNRNWRMMQLQDIVDGLFAICDARAKDPVILKAPGGATGFVTITIRMIQNTAGQRVPLIEHSVDAALIRELRSTLRQASKEFA